MNTQRSYLPSMKGFFFFFMILTLDCLRDLEEHLEGKEEPWFKGLNEVFLCRWEGNHSFQKL